MGSPGAPGRDGSDGLSIDTAIVREGDLLLGLTDGSIISAGRVMGLTGPSGERGPTGLPGKAGEDGAAVLSGPRTPNPDDGNDGDHWIDISTPEFGFYKKASGSWTKLANLRTPPGNVGGRMTPAAGGGAGGGTGGGGKGELQNTRTLPLINPTSFRKSIPAALPEPGTLLSQEDANKYLLKAVQNAMVTVGELPPEFPTDGQLWWCSAGDSLTLYIYLQDFNDDTQSVWSVASPPVSLEGIEASIAGVQDYIDIHVTPALAGAVGDIRTLDQEKASLNLPNVFTRSNQFKDKDDQPLLDIKPGAGAQYPAVQYYGMCIDNWDVVNKQVMDKAIEKAAGSGNAAQLDEDNVFTENNEFEKPIKVAQVGRLVMPALTDSSAHSGLSWTTRSTTCRVRLTCWMGALVPMRMPSVILARKTPIKTRRSRRTRKRSTRCHARKRVGSGGS